MVARIRRASRWTLAFLAAFAGFGAFLGYLISWWGSSTLGASIGAVFGLVLLIAVVLVLVVTAALVAWKRDDRLVAVSPVVRIAVLFLAAVGIGWAGTLAFGPHRPVYLKGGGTVSLSLPTLVGYDSHDAAHPECRSEADSQVVAWIYVDTAGKVGAGSVSVQLGMPSYPGAAFEVIVGVRPANGSQDGEVGWSGSAEAVEGAAGALRGRVAFTELVLHRYQSGLQPAGWPTNLSGTLAWSCSW